MRGYIETRTRNEALDLEVYALAALRLPPTEPSTGGSGGSQGGPGGGAGGRDGGSSWVQGWQ
jgi:hypothetical protein